MQFFFRSPGGADEADEGGAAEEEDGGSQEEQRDRSAQEGAAKTGGTCLCVCQGVFVVSLIHI